MDFNSLQYPDLERYLQQNLKINCKHEQGDRNQVVKIELILNDDIISEDWVTIYEN